MSKESSRSGQENITREVAGMSTHDVDPGRRERIRQSAHQILKENQSSVSFRGSRRIYRQVEPWLAAVLSAGYLAWAVERVLALWNV